ncbi:MAG: anaerobic ribonucleoside-triphosphate reductase activating protein [Candidatus Izemoplasmatales bacterium]
MIFAGMVKSSLIDYPGKIATVLFAPGCNFNCFYCHNRAIIEDIDTLLDPAEVDDFLVRRQGLVDAVVVSGGEPTLNRDLVAIFRRAKELGYLTKLDTNGSNPDAVKRLIDEGLVDYIAIDYKAPVWRYAEICGPEADGNLVLETIVMLLWAGVDFETRTTVIPQLSEKDLIRMAKEMPPVPRYVLNPYRKPKLFRPEDAARIEVPPYPEKTIARMAEVVKLYQPNVVLMF